MKNKGRKFEKKFIETINSGAFNNDADANSDKHCLEIKFTDKKGFRITTKLLKKLWEQSFDQCKLPLFGIGIRDKEKRELWMMKVNIVKERI